jgi:hypothetical protein
MKKTLITTALAAILSTGTIATATAGPANTKAPSVSTSIELVGHRSHDRDFRGKKSNGYYVLPSHVVRYKLYRYGYRDIRKVGFFRGNYIFMARGYRGPVKLVVDGRTGHVVSRHRIRHWFGKGLHFGSHSGKFSFSVGIH